MEKMSIEQLAKSYNEVNEAFKKFVKRVTEVRVNDMFLNRPVLRVFISVPMNGRTEEAIKADIEEAKAAFNKFFGLGVLGDCIEFVNTFVKNKAPDECRNDRIWYLGNSIKVLSTCDVVLFAEGAYDARGCNIESQIADSYGIPSIWIYKRHNRNTSSFDYFDNRLNLYVPEKEETKPKYMTEEAYKEWRKVIDEEDRKEWQKVMNEVDGIEQR